MTRIEYTTDYNARLKSLTNPKSTDTVNALVVSNIIRKLEIAMLVEEAEKRLADSELIQKSIGRNLIFIGEVADAHNDGKIDLFNLTVVGEIFGDYSTPLRTSMSNLVAESITLDIRDFDFANITGKILVGTTFLFSAYVAKDTNGTTYLSKPKVIEIGLKTFKEDGSLDELVNFQLDVNTFGHEVYILENGELSYNSINNPVFNKYIRRYNEDSDKQYLHRAFEKALNLYDDITIRDRENLAKIL